MKILAASLSASPKLHDKVRRDVYGRKHHYQYEYAKYNICNVFIVISHRYIPQLVINAAITRMAKSGTRVT